jgi:hypothetical protein
MRWCLAAALLSLATAASPSEVSALVDIFVATSGSTWTARAGWGADAVAVADPCTAPLWTGVGCDGSSVV